MNTARVICVCSMYDRARGGAGGGLPGDGRGSGEQRSGNNAAQLQIHDFPHNHDRSFQWRVVLTLHVVSYSHFIYMISNS